MLPVEADSFVTWANDWTLRVLAIGCPPRGLLHRDAWASSKHGGWISKVNVPRNRKEKLSVPPKTSIGYWLSVMSVYTWSSSHWVQIRGEGTRTLLLGGRSVRDLGAMFETTRVGLTESVLPSHKTSPKFRFCLLPAVFSEGMKKVMSIIWTQL